MVGLTATLDAPASAFAAASAVASDPETNNDTGGGISFTTLGGGQSSRSVIGDIAKVVKIAELLGTVGETVIPALVSAGTAAVGGVSADGGPVAQAAQAAQRSADELLGSGDAGSTSLKQRLLHTFRPQELLLPEDVAAKMPARER